MGKGPASCGNRRIGRRGATQAKTKGKFKNHHDLDRTVKPIEACKRE